MGYSFRLAARVCLYASCHRQDNAYHSLCYTSHGALAGTRYSSISPLWRIDPTIHHILSKRSYYGATSHSLDECQINQWVHQNDPSHNERKLYHSPTSRSIYLKTDKFQIEYSVIFPYSHHIIFTVGSVLDTLYKRAQNSTVVWALGWSEINPRKPTMFFFWGGGFIKIFSTLLYLLIKMCWIHCWMDNTNQSTV